MADPQFFKKSKSFTLAELAEIAGAEVMDAANADYEVADVAALDQAGENQISFLDNVKYKEQFTHTKAGACIIAPALAELAPDGVKLLVSKHPYKSYAKIAQAFYPDAKPEGYISDKAFIHESAEIGEGCTIENGVHISEGAVIGAQSWVEAGAYIGPSVQIGTGCRIGVNSTLSHCHIGDYSRIYTGARIGQDGFGFAIDPTGHVKVPQLGRVIVESHVEIGANTTIDRGAGPDTVIGQGTWIDNLVQIGHNVKIGRGCVIVAQVGISGSTVIEDFVAIGGQVGIAGHLNIGQGVRIAAQSGIMRNIEAGQEVMGSPAVPIKQFMKQVAMLKRLIKKG